MPDQMRTAREEIDAYCERLKVAAAASGYTATRGGLSLSATGPWSDEAVVHALGAASPLQMAGSRRVDVDAIWDDFFNGHTRAEPEPGRRRSWWEIAMAPVLELWRYVRRWVG